MNTIVCGNVLKPYVCNRIIARYNSPHQDIQRRFSKKQSISMPRDQPYLKAMQQQREKLKMKSKRYTPSHVSLQVLGTGAPGGTTALYVSTNHTKYLFNCGEGTQRLAHEHRLKLAKLEHIFLTTASWKNIGGLPGTALTLQDNGVQELEIHGPKGCSDLFRAVEQFVILKNLNVKEATCSVEKAFVDQTMSVSYVLLRNKNSKEESTSNGEEGSLPLDDTDYYAYDVNSNGKRISAQESQKRKVARLQALLNKNKIEGSMAYICKLHSKLGRLEIEKCADKGVPPGPLLGDLKAGKDVTLPNGTVVRSSDVCSPEEPGPLFIVLECPSEDYLDALTNSEAFAKHQSSQLDGDPDVAVCVVHFTPEKVLNNPSYRQWMEKFPATTRHVIINEENKCKGSEAIHRIQYKLHLLHPDIFPILDTEGCVIDNRKKSTNDDIDDEIRKMDEANTPQDEIIKVSRVPEEFPLIHRVDTMDAVILRPPTGFNTDNKVTITPRQYIDETFAVDGFLDILAELQTEINARSKNLDAEDDYPKIVMLGTGSCIPNKTRNTSGILLRLDKDTSILLDCGEGTAGQLIRFYGKTEFEKILLTIKAIYISHLHADHHIGLMGLLHSHERLTNDPLVLLAPEQIYGWLRMYHKRFAPIADKYHLISNRQLILDKGNTSVSVKLRLQELIPGVQFNTVHVRHCPHAFGVSITSEKGCKIVYSGDTMPCSDLVDLGDSCDLLIHEATMEDDLENEAKLKFHSTISQAIGVGERMKAKFILLTHFSQRYSKLPHLPDNREDSPDLSRVGIAYDNMQVSLSQLNLLPLFYPALKSMFSEFHNLLEEKSVKRQMRVERETRRALSAAK